MGRDTDEGRVQAVKSGAGRVVAVKKCKVCKADFQPVRPMQSVCSTACAIEMAKTKRAKQDRQKAQQERKTDRQKREKLKTKGEWLNEAQAAFNRYIRLRDHGLPCICCGKPMGENVPGGAVDAGHYRSRGSAPHLRFDERNVHAQRKQCNRYDSGNVVGYRLGLIERIGLEQVEQLESDQTPRRYSVEDLQQIKATYTAKARAIKKV